MNAAEQATLRMERNRGEERERQRDRAKERERERNEGKKDKSIATGTIEKNHKNQHYNGIYQQ